MRCSGALLAVTLMTAIETIDCRGHGRDSAKTNCHLSCAIRMKNIFSKFRVLFFSPPACHPDRAMLLRF